MKKIGFIGCIALMVLSLVSCSKPHVHDLYKVEQVDATCINEGTKEYYKCAIESCQKMFLDREATNEVSLEDLVIEPTGIHQGGQATCTSKAICEVCGKEYGELGQHVYSEEVVDDKYLASEATCAEKAVYYKSCTCGEKGTETFTYGEPLGHDHVEYDGKDNLVCDRCGEYYQILDFENAASNAWNEDGAEYRDKLWKTVADGKEGAHGEFVVGQLNQIIEEDGLNGKVYLEFEVSSTKEIDAKLSIAMLLGAGEVSKNVFKVTVNGQDVAMEGNLTSQYADYNHVEINELTNINLMPGFNTIRFTIMDSPKADIDYIVLESKECLNEHDFAYEYDDDYHFLKCQDDGCDVEILKENHDFSQEVRADEYLKDAGDCTHGPTYYKSCICGKAGSETFGGEITGENHTYNQEVADPKYLAKEATCLESAKYYYSCICGEKGAETFTYGEPLGHDYQPMGSDINNLKCSRCESYKHIEEFENMRSNAWNEDGAEYRDELWKTAGDAYHGGMCVKRINDCGINYSGKIYFEFDVTVLKEIQTDLHMVLSTGGTEILKSSFGVYINGDLVNVGEDKFVSPNSDDWNKDIFRDYFYSTIALKEGINTIRFVINNGCSCNADYIYFEGDTLVSEHDLVLDHDETGHWYKCVDEGCNERTETIAHTFDQKNTDEAYAAEDGKYYYSCICGEKGTETFDTGVHVHNMVQQVPGKNDVKVCSCGMMERRFDLAASYSESWSEGTAKTDALWRQLNQGSPLDSGNYVGHIGDAVNDGLHDNVHWIEIALTIDSETDIEAELILNTGVGGGDWSNLTLTVNNEEIHPTTPLVGTGWTDFTDYSAGVITLKANQTNVIRISPKFGCLMNWCYLQVNSSCNTFNVTDSLIG